MFKDLGLLNFFTDRVDTIDPLEVYTGRKAVAQKYAIIFCTEIQSIFMDKSLGTDFLIEKNNKNLTNSVFHILNIANLDTIESMRGDLETQEDNGIVYEDEEKIKSAEITSISSIDDAAYVQITVLTEANSSEDITIPLN